MIARRPARAGHGGMSAWASQERRNCCRLEELEAAGGLRTGRKHILSILVENKPGVLTRVAGLFARRGFNIDTLTVGPTDDEHVSRITLTVDGALHPIDQVTKQLHKLVNVLKIRDLEPTDTVSRELALFKARGRRLGSAREVMQICEIFRGKVVDVTRRSVILEITGTTDKIEAFERHGAPVRAGRDDAHGRDRDLAAAAARPERGLASRRVRRRHGRRRVSSDAMPATSRHWAAWSPLDASARRRSRARCCERLSGRCGARAAARGRRRSLRRDHSCRSPREVDPTAVARRLARGAGEPWFCIEQPDRDGAALAALGAVVRARGGAGPSASARSPRAGGRSRARRVADPPDGPRGAGLDRRRRVRVRARRRRDARTGRRFAPASLHVPEVALARRGDEVAADARRARRARRHARRAARARSSARARRAAQRAAAAARPRPGRPLRASRRDAARALRGRGRARRSSASARARSRRSCWRARSQVHAPAPHDAGRGLRRPARGASRRATCFCVGPRRRRASSRASPELLVRREGLRAGDARARRLDAPQRRPVGRRPPRRAAAALATRTARSRRSSRAASSARCGRTSVWVTAAARAGDRADGEHPAPRDADPRAAAAAGRRGRARRRCCIRRRPSAASRSRRRRR